VHDGVLQVLALVQRRGGELAGELAPGPGRELAELARLAGEQERELRRLVRTGQNPPATASSVDLAGELTRLEADGPVTVSTPGFPVELAAPAARELLAATRACLDNVRAHVGAEAPAWVLLEAHADRVEVSVRDDGPGIAPGRLEAAAAGGRLGVRESIRGRLAELGGSARLTTGSCGTEWLLTVPLGTGRADGEER
jgi:signal transduction histidine kinase